MELTFTQCKQLAENYGDLRGIVEQLKDQPYWITEELEMYDIQAIQQGGCASGAYMPAVTYYTAQQIMGIHGNDVLEFIEGILGELPEIPRDESRFRIAVMFLSLAVELWCSQFNLDGIDV